MSDADAKLFKRPSRSATLWPAGPRRAETVRVFSLNVNNDYIQEAVDRLISAARSAQSTTVAFINAHTINCMANDPAFARTLGSADVRYADGSGMALAARLAGQPLVDNVNGTDLLPLLASRAESKGLSLFLLGGREGVAEAAAERLVARNPNLRIAGVHHGYFPPGSDDERAVIEKINASDADFLLVAMGVPAQEAWLQRNRDNLRPKVRLGVGGLFDFFSGRVPRAPFYLRTLGLEWTYRLAQEPKRMWRRYLVGNLTFLGRALVHAARARTELTMLSSIHTVVAEARWAIYKNTRRTINRAFDIIGASAGILLLSPVLVGAALAVRIESRGPIIFRQTRVGLNGRPFMILKFRSMFDGADKLHAGLQGSVTSAHAIRFKAVHDPRVTRVGRFIRRTSIDELPQLFNVLRGDMSIVGPRPALPSEVARYAVTDRDRLLVKPGITCIWQVSGRADIDFVGQVRLDRQYVTTRSVLGDIVLILRTIPAILSGRGSY